MLKIFLIRHSESQDDLNNSYGGFADWDITKRGILKAQNFIITFKKFGIEKIYSSPLKRAHKTALILAGSQSLEVTEIYDLHETNTYGYTTGVEKNLAKELFGWMQPEIIDTSYYSRKCFYGGETPDDLDTRVKNVFQKISKNSRKNKIIGIITHGGMIKSFFWSILNDKRKIKKIHDLGFAELSFDSNGFKCLKTEGIDFQK